MIFPFMVRRDYLPRQSLQNSAVIPFVIQGLLKVAVALRNFRQCGNANFANKQMSRITPFFVLMNHDL
jgi:hypothetical protein